MGLSVSSACLGSGAAAAVEMIAKQIAKVLRTGAMTVICVRLFDCVRLLFVFDCCLCSTVVCV